MNALSSRHMAPSSVRTGLIVVLLYALVTMLVWARTSHDAFVWDDEYFIVRNASLRQWSSIPAFFTDISTSAGGGREAQFAVFRPLRNLSYLLDFKLAGLNPAWWHVHNVLLHLANALLVYGVARILLSSGLAPLAAGLLFLTHPVQTEVVAWVKCRDDLLAAFWVLATTWFWLRRRRSPPGPWHTVTLTAGFLLACLSKVQAIALPIALAAIEALCPQGGEPSPRALRRLLRPVTLMLATAIAFVVWRRLFIGRTSQTAPLAGSFGATMLTMVRAAAAYLGLLVAPVRQLADYSGMEPSTHFADARLWICAAIILTCGAAALKFRRRWPVAVLGFAWIVIFLLPVSNIVPMMQYMAERFLYLPMAGFALLVGALLARIEHRRPRVAVALAVLLIATTGGMAARRAAVWQSDQTLFSATVQAAPSRAERPRRNLLVALLNAGRWEPARPLAERLWSETADDPETPPRRQAEYARHLGIIDLRTGHTEAGLALMHAAVRIDPSYVEPYLALGLHAGLSGRHTEALDWFEHAVAADPQNASAHYNRGVALLANEREDDAIAAFHQAIAAGPTSPDAHKALAAVLWRRGQLDPAAALYEEAARLWPADADIRHWLEQARNLSRIKGNDI